MCKKYRTIHGVAVAGLLLLLLAFAPQPVRASCGCDTFACTVSFENAVTGVGIDPGFPVVAGTTIKVTVLVNPNGLFCPPPNQTKPPCEFHHGVLTLTHPDGFVETLSADLPITHGVSAPLVFVSTHIDVLSTSGSKLWIN